MRILYISFRLYSSEIRLVIPCYLVPSRRNRPLATSMVAIIHPAHSIASSRRFIIYFDRYFCILSSQVQCGLPLPRRPSILPSIIFNSIISDLITCPKKDRAALTILDSSVLLGCIMSIISVFFFLSK